VAAAGTLSVMAKLTNNEMLKGLHDPGDGRSRNELFKQVGRVVRRILRKSCCRSFRCKCG
jgi:hypothetical protein